METLKITINMDSLGEDPYFKAAVILHHFVFVLMHHDYVEHDLRDESNHIVGIAEIKDG